MSPPLQFLVPGNPIPLARARVVSGHAFTPARSVAYGVMVGFYAKRSMALHQRGTFPMKGPVRMVCEFHRGDERRCDLDNLVKAAKDALTAARVWDDDSQVVELVARKAVSKREPRAEILVELMPAGA